MPLSSTYRMQEQGSYKTFTANASGGRFMFVSWDFVSHWNLREVIISNPSL